jgi:hypothetical protein
MDVKQAHRIVHTYINNANSYRGVGDDQVVRCAIETLVGNGNCAHGRISLAEFALCVASAANLPIEENGDVLTISATGA